MRLKDSAKQVIVGNVEHNRNSDAKGDMLYNFTWEAQKQGKLN